MKKAKVQYVVLRDLFVTHFLKTEKDVKYIRELLEHNTSKTAMIVTV